MPPRTWCWKSDEDNEERPFDARDYTGGKAAGLYYRLRRRATVVSLSDLVEKVALSLD